METLYERLDAQFKDAFRNRRTDEKAFLGFIKADITKDEKNPSDEKVDAYLRSMRKKLQDNIQNRESFDDSWNEKNELEIVESFLPKQMSEEDVVSKINEVISGGANNIGMIMKAFAGLEVDKKLVSIKAKELLG